ELANAVKPVMLPGEAMTVQVLREGKEPGQGVGYLEDGTMVVIEHGRRYIGRALDVVVTSVLQTSAGRMIFTRARDDAAASAVAKDASLTVVAGGRTRQDSVWLALQAAPEDAEIVVVHDAVRLLITRHLIDAVVRAAAAEGAAICALPIMETVKRVRAKRVEATLDRSELWAVQTPQAFRADLLREAHEKARRDGVVGTDDAVLVERLGHPVRVVHGLVENVKI